MDFNDSKHIVTDSFDATSRAGTVVSPVIDAAGFGAIEWQLSQESGTIANGTSVKIQASVSGTAWTDMRTHGGGATSNQAGVDRSVGQLATYGIQGRFRLIRFVMHTASGSAATAKLHIHLSRI
jgi:hypothetical protein